MDTTIKTFQGDAMQELVFFAAGFPAEMLWSLPAACAALCLVSAAAFLFITRPSPHMADGPQPGGSSRLAAPGTGAGDAADPFVSGPFSKAVPVSHGPARPIPAPFPSRGPSGLRQAAAFRPRPGPWEPIGPPPDAVTLQLFDDDIPPYDLWLPGKWTARAESVRRP
ncbi:MAG: hypothetical protein LBQ12_14115 [Deltaproteobacteria bacterium]|jgi:hypothetical protein|nr:hypothetical protein [Deltaproteobacteria bacterium]